MLFLFRTKPEIIVTAIIVSVAYTFFIFIFLRLELSDKIDFMKKEMDKISDEKYSLSENNYEEKLFELCGITRELEEKKFFLGANKEVSELQARLLTVIKRLIDELNTAKVFKINRNEFLGNVSHELRTPIFAIQLSLETLIDGAVNDENVSMDFLNRALKQTERLRELVDDLINISKLEAGMKISKRYFEINRFIKDVVTELSGLSEKRNVVIKIESGVSDKTMAFGDEERLKQVFVNLIDNATKYAAENGEIIIGIRNTEKDVIISVKDNGVGIPKEDLPRIFERFYRVDKTRSRDMGGSGLGLSIVKHILELHNSTIRVESEEGKGTKFEFNLPS